MYQMKLNLSLALSIDIFHYLFASIDKEILYMDECMRSMWFEFNSNDMRAVCRFPFDSNFNDDDDTHDAMRSTLDAVFMQPNKMHTGTNSFVCSNSKLYRLKCACRRSKKQSKRSKQREP